jgi:DNA-directed RNA polymerase subunit alpha
VLQKNWQTLIKPKQLSVEPGDDADRVATVVAEPLERGFGLTLGNALRRVLLSSLQGAAVTSMQIEGVLHEFSSLPGVLEDVTDIVLNVKGIGLRMHGDGPKRMRLRASGPGEVRARQIETGHDIEILNPDQVVCTLDSGAHVVMELTVENGKGYVPATQNRPEDAPIGLIPVDALFSPVRKISYRVENTRVGQVTDYDSLSMRVETNGAVTPEDAVALAARILQDQLQLFINFEEPRHAIEKELSGEPLINKNLLRKVGAFGQLSEERQHRLYRRPRAEDRGGDAADAQFRPQILERDQGSAGQYGAPSGDGDPGLAARKHRRAGEADRRAVLISAAR